MNKSAPLLLLSISLTASAFQRDLSPDRPDATESPFTVEPGAFQIESSLWSFAKDGSNETRSLGETNFKYGLTSSHDLHLVLRPWIQEKTNAGDSEGFGDIDLRLKWNLWGNDGGTTAGALLPYLTIPTHTAVSTGEWEGGIIFPVSVELTENLDLGFQIAAARAWNDDGSKYGWDIFHSAVLGIALTENIGTFLEYVGVTGDGPYEASANTGLTWAVNDNLQWDMIFSAGLNDAAEDFSIAQGITFRF